jgi:hypothetical protein
MPMLYSGICNRCLRPFSGPDLAQLQTDIEQCDHVLMPNNPVESTPTLSVLNASDKRWLVKLAKLVIAMSSSTNSKITAIDEARLMAQLNKMEHE